MSELSARRDGPLPPLTRAAIEERLREREELFELELENAPLAILTCDLQGRLLTANRAACELFGYRPEELQTLKITDLTHPDDCPRCVEMTRRAARGEVDRYVEKRRYRRRDGTVIRGELHVGVAHGADGRPLKLVLQVEDHSQRLRAQEEADRLRERLAHVGRLGTLGEMAAGIAHEINQPLTAITNYARACQRLLRAGRGSDPRLLEALDKVSDQAKRAGEVVERLRDLVRKRDSRRERADVNELVTGVVRLAQAEARLRDVTLRVELAERTPPVVADGVQVQQVVLNLIHNGLEAMEGLDRRDRELVVRTAAGDGSEIEVAVADRGKGVAEEAREELFQPFFTTKAAGMGMGLSICRSIVRSHGGRLWFTPNPGRGTTFHFTLPAAARAGR